MDIIIFGGQSNMQGQTETLSECVEVPGAFEYKWITDSIVPLKNPVGEDIRYDGDAGWRIVEGGSASDWRAAHGLGSACYGNTNMVPAFCRAYLQNANTPVISVHAAKGSTQIKDWLPGTDGWRLLSQKSKAAIAYVQAHGTLGHVFFAWLQGESDAIFSVSKNDYKRMLEELATALQKEVGVEQFGIIRVGEFVKDERDMEIIAAQDEICQEDDRFLMLTDIALTLNKMPEMMNPKVGGHYSALGLETLGTAAGKALREFANAQDIGPSH